MSLLDEPVADADAPASVPVAQRRRWRWPWVVGTLFVALIGAGVFAYEWAAHYQPISGGSLLIAPTSTSKGLVLASDSKNARYRELVRLLDQPDAEFAPAFVDSPRPGESFWFGVDVTNGGPFAVTVDEVALDPGTDPSLATTFGVSVHDGRRSTPEMGPPYVAVSSHVLVPRVPRGIQVKVRVPACSAGTSNVKADGTQDAVTTFATLYVTSKFLWFAHVARVPILTPVYVVNAPSCPGAG